MFAFVRRWHKDGILKVDDEEDIVGQSEGSQRYPGFLIKRESE